MQVLTHLIVKHKLIAQKWEKAITQDVCQSSSQQLPKPGPKALMVVFSQRCDLTEILIVKMEIVKNSHSGTLFTHAT